MKNNWIIIIMILLGVSCSTGPDFERDNENDSGSNSFLPDISNLSVQINSDKTVTVNWKDNSKFEEGYIVSKSLGDSLNFVPLDTLKPNSEVYIDSSEHLSIPTYYRVLGLKKNQNDLDLSTRTIQLNFGEITDIDIYSIGNEIFIDWNNMSVFADKYTIEKKIDNNWELIEEIEPIALEYSFTEQKEQFLMDIRITALLLDSENQFSVVDSVILNDVQYNHPSDFSVTINSEATATFSWQDQTPFDDQFIIVQRAVDNEVPGEFTPIDTISGTTADLFINYQPEDEYQFSIVPLFEDHSGSYIQPTSKVISTKAPTLRSYLSLSESELQVSWIDNNRSTTEGEYPTYKFFVELYDQNEVLVESKEFSPEIDSYTFNDLHSNTEYVAKIRSYSSPYNISHFRYTQNLKVNKEDDRYTGAVHYDLQPYVEDSYIVGTGITNKNMTGISTLNSITGDIELEYDFDPYFNNFSISHDKNLLAIAYEYRIEVYDIAGNQPSLKTSIHSFSAGTFINDEEMILGKGNDFFRWNTTTNDTTKISSVTNKIEKYEIAEIYPAKSGNSIIFRYKDNYLNNYRSYHYDIKSDTETAFEDNWVYFQDLNKNDEALLSHESTVYRIDNSGEIVTTYHYPDLKEFSEQRITKAVFLNDDLVITGTYRGFLHLYDKNTGTYLSSNRFEVALAEYSEIENLAVSQANNMVMMINRGKYFKILEPTSSWHKLY